MKKLLCLPLFLFLLLSLQAQSEEEILQEHFASHRQNFWDKINTLVIDARWIDENYEGHEVKFSLKAPDKIRIEGKYQSETFIEAFDGTSGWIQAPWKKETSASRQSELEELVLRNSFTLGSPLAPFREHLNFLGLKDKNGELYHAFSLDEGIYKKTFYLSRADSKLQYEEIENKLGNEVVKVLKSYDKYKTYGPIFVPAAIYFEAEGLEKEFVFDDYYFDLGVNDEVFEYPEGQ